MAIPMTMMDPDDPKLKNQTWENIEKELNMRDAAKIATLGYDIDDPEDSGPSFMHPCKPLYSSFPWETKIEPFAEPAKCTLKTWKHTCLKYELKTGCATLTLSKGATNNTIDPAMMDALQDAILDLQKNKDARVVILKAEGKLFSNGLDPKYIMSESQKSAAEIEAYQLRFAKILYFLSKLPQYVCALVQGSAMGASIGLLCACDQIISVKSSFFNLNEGKLGVVGTVALPYIMNRITYMAFTRQLVLTAAAITAEQALEWNLINEVVEDAAGLQTAAQSLCDKLTFCAPGAVAATKEIVMNTVGQAPSSFMMNYVSTVLASVRKGAEARTGIEAVQNKKKPAWAEKKIEA